MMKRGNEKMYKANRELFPEPPNEFVDVEAGCSGPCSLIEGLSEHSSDREFIAATTSVDERSASPLQMVEKDLKKKRNRAKRRRKKRKLQRAVETLVLLSESDVASDVSIGDIPAVEVVDVEEISTLDLRGDDVPSLDVFPDPPGTRKGTFYTLGPGCHVGPFIFRDGCLTIILH